MDRRKALKESAEATKNETWDFDPNIVSESQFRPLLRKANGELLEFPKMVTSQTTVETVRQQIADLLVQDINKFNLLHLGQTLQPNQTLKFYNINNNTCVIQMTQNVDGGAKESKERSFDPKNPFIRSTDKPDCITFDNDPKYPRALMPCGHAVTSQTMFDWVTTLFQKNEKIADVRCPLVKCRKLWNWVLVVAVANMTPEENLRFTTERERRLGSDKNFKYCPNCKIIVQRPTDLTMFRVRCSACSGSDFCFVCCKPWKGGGFQVCGNPNCSAEYLNKVLKECPMKQPDYWPQGSKVPSLRACPKCLTLIQHESKCKHMKCVNCSTDFCFSCLSLRTATGWTCKSHTDVCPVASRQVLK